MPGSRWVVTLIGVTLVSCSGTARGCTMMGASSAIGIQLPDEGWEVAEFCIDGACDLAGADFALLPVADDVAEYSYDLTVIDPAGVVHKAEGLVTTELGYPNGKGCDPEVASATLVIDRDGEVTVENPWRAPGEGE